MKKQLQVLILNILLVAISGCATTPKYSQSRHYVDTQGQLFDGMGTHQRTITTTSDEANRYIQQGLIWSYSFNHGEAIRSFRRATELDSQCAMAWWGIALCEGPNYNDTDMSDERSSAAWDALQEALARIKNTSPVERALIEALSHRYSKPWPEDRTALEQSYADAMAKVWAKFPNDSDVGTLYAEAMMVQTPWKLYTPDHVPAKDTGKIVSVLERVMEMDPGNPGANHLYIHAVEPSSNPDRGLAAADRLSNLVPASGHLLHMPSHIHVKTGFWEKAITQNQKAVRSDKMYRSLSPRQTMQYGYMVHNAHMLAYAAMMSGRENEALAAARTMWEITPEKTLEKVGPIFDRWMCSVYDVQKRFGRWDDILDEPAPPSYMPITKATWLASRAVAYAAKKDFANAEHEHEKFREAMNSLPEGHKWSTRDSALKVLAVSDYFIAGEIALQKGNWKLAAELLEKSAEKEDALTYGEPPQWLQPVRHTLGAVYLMSGRYEDAERVYREDLAKWRNNGWSLFGLSRALQRQGKSIEASEIEDQYWRVWSKAAEPTTTSCKCIPKT